MPISPEFHLRRAADGDRRRILELEEIGIRAHAEALWGNWRPSACPETLDLAGHEMVMRDGAALGVIQTVRAPNHHQIAKLYLDPEAQGQGVGTALLRLRQDAARKAELPLRVRGLTTNVAARRFYERAGFRLVDETAERWFWQWSPETGQTGSKARAPSQKL
ncbi:GNAT family N-acetyltransferase [Pseudaestuariivita sp.]|uniref:GNAT family N-acetyltransferase n=1 Tax=Pseudaestuariivita sp. TaxID=2211669 RepID=UPI0040581A79